VDLEKIFCAYKLDCSKAYDRVDWNFLEQMLQTLGFDLRSTEDEVDHDICHHGDIHDKI
jgi:hypothetical protein